MFDLIIKSRRHQINVVNILLNVMINRHKILLIFYLLFILNFHRHSSRTFVHSQKDGLVKEAAHIERQYLLEQLNLNKYENVIRLKEAAAMASNSVSYAAPMSFILSNANQHHDLTKLKNVNNIAYHNGYLYVGAQNWLLKLNAVTLNLEQSVRYGPVLDSPNCRYSPIEECLNNPTLQNQDFSQTKYLMNNFNKLLIIYEQKNALLTCWTARQGVCDLRDLNDLNMVIQNTSISAVANDPFNSTVGFIASSANSQDLFYIASTYNNFGPYRDEIPSLAGRSLSTAANNNNKFMQILTSNSQGLKSSKASIEFISRFMKTFIVKYVSAFNLGIYNYFLTVQHMDTDSMSKGDLLITKLGRLCLNDLSFAKSYIEMPLKCTSGSSISLSSLRSIDYNELISARLVYIKNANGDASTSSSSSQNNDLDNYYLIGLFQHSTRTTFNSSLPQDIDDETSGESSQPIKQAVCMFSMKQIQNKIKDNLRKCYNSNNNNEFSNVMRGLNFIKPDQRCSNNRNRLFSQLKSDYSTSSSTQIGDDFCSSADNGLYPIGGQMPAISNALIEFDTQQQHQVSSVFFDAIQVYSNQIATTLLLMSNKRQELRFFHLKLPLLTSTTPINYRTLKLTQEMAKNSKEYIESDLVKVPLSNLEFEKTSIDQSSTITPSNLFLISSKTNEIFKLKMSSCESFKTCGECLAKSSLQDNNNNGDPYCGWCPSLNECTTYSKCSSDSLTQVDQSKWLNGQLLLKNNNFSALNIFESMCVDIKSIEPLVTYKSKLQSDWVEINFAKELSAVNNNNGSYKCVFEIQKNFQQLTSDAIQITNNKLKCHLPHISKIQHLFRLNTYHKQNLVMSDDGLFLVMPDGQYYYENQYDRIHLPVYVQQQQSSNILKYGTVASANGAESTLFNVTVMDCSAHKSCISCLSTSCKWCSNKCLNQNDQDDLTCLTSNNVNRCSAFDTGTNKLLIPFTAHRQQAPLTFLMSNVNQNNHKLECMFTLFNGRFLDRNVSVPFSFINKTHAHCTLTNVFNLLNDLLTVNNQNENEDSILIGNNNGQIQTNLRLYDANNDIFIDSSSNGKLALLFYKCELKANDCSQCLSLNRQLSCMWCNNNLPVALTTTTSAPGTSSCKFMNAQSKLAAVSQCISPLHVLFTGLNNQSSNKPSYNQCDRPQINAIQPTKLPIAGGTVIIVSGINLGSTFDDLVGVFIVCGVDQHINSTSNTDQHTKCDLLQNKYIPSKQIACKTRQSVSGVQNNCKLTIKIRTNLIDASTSQNRLQQPSLINIVVSSNQLIQFVEPLIGDIQPATIIQSANFVWLNLKGVDLDAGKARQIQIIDYSSQQQANNNQMIEEDDVSLNSRIIKCEIKNVSSTDIKCRLNDKFKTLGKKNVKLIFDDNMSIMHYLSLRVTSDPLVKSIDKQVTMHTGGTQFRLYGFNFDAVQSAYTYINYKDLWYSEPVQARSRISNEFILFDFPSLTESFFDLVKQQQLVFTLPGSNGAIRTSTAQQMNNERYDFQIGFLMDGFNVTLKDTSILYLPTLTSQLVSVKNLDIQMVNQNEFQLVVDFKIDASLFSQSIEAASLATMLKEDLQVYISCSVCSKLTWLNESRAVCQLPSVISTIGKKFTQQQHFCEPKAFNSMLSNLNLNSKLKLVHLYVGNYELTQQQEFSEFNQNLKIYLQTYSFNNVDNYLNVVQSLVASSSNQNNRALLDELIKRQQQASSQLNNGDSLLLSSTSSSKNLFLISAVISALIVMLIAFTIILVTIVIKMKLKCKSINANNLNNNNNKVIQFGLAPNTNTGSMMNNKKSEKQLKIEYERIKQQIDQLELVVRPKCTQLFQQLHNDYLNDLNNDLLFKLNSGNCLPIWNYKTYLFNLLFPTSTISPMQTSNLVALVDLPPLNTSSPSSASSTSSSTSPSTCASLLPNTTAISTITAKNFINQNSNNLMSLSSMSNSTTNTLLSSAANNQNSGMSVYATIKSSNMLKFDAENGSTSSNVVEAMNLFDQLMHNKNFLLAFIQVCEQQTPNSFTLKDRCNLASLLILSLRDNLPYLYSIIKSLLSDYIANCFQSSSNSTKQASFKGKQLFRSNETLIEHLLTNWIAMFMYEYNNTSQSSTNLFRLVKVIKYYLDMGPCDQQTQLSANTLNDELLLNDHIQYQTIYVNVLNRCIMQANSTNALANASNFQVCPLLDCDTIYQAKEKIIDSIYSKTVNLLLSQANGGAVMTRPSVKDVELELCLLLIQNDSNNLNEQATTTIILKETEDELIGDCNLNELKPHVMKRLLTLKDYNIQNGSFLNLVFKNQQQIVNANVDHNEAQANVNNNNNHVYMSTLSMNNEYVLYAPNTQLTQQQQTASHKPLPLPLVPPPPLPSSSKNRYHLQKPSLNNNQDNQLITFSTASSSTCSSTDSSASGTVVLPSRLNTQQSLNKKKKSSKKKKYEKLLTVKSQDSSSVTTASLLTSTNSRQQTTTTSSLTRLLINKGTVQPFIDQFVETIFANTSNLPPIIQHLFEFFDQEAKKYQSQFSTLSGKEKNLTMLNDEVSKMTRCWKTNSYFMRYWVSLIKNPEILLDVEKTGLIDASLNCISQAFSDSCSTSESFNLYDTSSPINRLLFIHEVPRYKQMIENFYSELKSYQPISDHELHFYLNEFAKCQHQQFSQQQIGSLINTNNFNTAQKNGYNNSTGANDVNSLKILLQLYEYYEKYEQPINALIGQQQCSILLPVHHRLVQIKELMNQPNGGHQISSLAHHQSFTAATLQHHTLNRPYLQLLQQQQQQQQYNPYQQLNNSSTGQYQQPINCYATTNELMLNQSSQYPTIHHQLQLNTAATVNTANTNNNNQNHHNNNNNQQHFF